MTSALRKRITPRLFFHCVSSLVLVFILSHFIPAILYLLVFASVSYVLDGKPLAAALLPLANKLDKYLNR